MKGKLFFGFWILLAIIALALKFLPERKQVYQKQEPIVEEISIVPSRMDGKTVVHGSDSSVVLHTKNVVKEEILYQGADADADTIFRKELPNNEERFLLGELRLEGEVWARVYGADGTSVESRHIPITYERQQVPEVVIESPVANSIISTPLVLKGKARGTWFFEANMPVSIFDENNKLIAKGPLQAKGEWMTEDFVEFEGKLSFGAPTANTGYVLFENDNPSGLPEYAKSFAVPVRFR
ncbi:MAG: Gmad2 immunoglobulin-like domain-containing protein [Patescibacteria group bacterium]